MRQCEPYKAVKLTALTCRAYRTRDSCVVRKTGQRLSRRRGAEIVFGFGERKVCAPLGALIRPSAGLKVCNL